MMVIIGSKRCNSPLFFILPYEWTTYLMHFLGGPPLGPEAEYLELFLGYKHNYRNRKVCNKKMEIIESITLATGETLCGRQLAVCCGPSVGDRSSSIVRGV